MHAEWIHSELFRRMHADWIHAWIGLYILAVMTPRAIYFGFGNFRNHHNRGLSTPFLQRWFRWVLEKYQFWEQNRYEIKKEKEEGKGKGVSPFGLFSLRIPTLFSTSRFFELTPVLFSTIAMSSNNNLIFESPATRSIVLIRKKWLWLFFFFFPHCIKRGRKVTASRLDEKNPPEKSIPFPCLCTMKLELQGQEDWSQGLWST